MKNLWLGLMLLAVSVQAQTFTQFLQDAVGRAEVDSAFDLKGDKFAAAYVPIRTLNYPFQNMMDTGFGGIFGAGTPEGLVSIRLNVPQLINGLFGLKWFTSHTTGPTLPTLFIGPSIKAEWPITTWTWKKDTFLLIGLPLSNLP